jgi:hypothetical protein
VWQRESSLKIEKPELVSIFLLSQKKNAAGLPKLADTRASSAAWRLKSFEIAARRPSPTLGCSRRAAEAPDLKPRGAKYELPARGFSEARRVVPHDRSAQRSRKFWDAPAISAQPRT